MIQDLNLPCIIGFHYFINNDIDNMAESFYNEQKEMKDHGFDEEEIEPNATMEYYTNKGFNDEFNLHKGGNNILNRYNGIKLDQSGNIDDDKFIKLVLNILKKNKININEKNIVETKYKCLPDKSDEFMNYFVDVEKGTSKNLKLFQRRILGLSSYFRSPVSSHFLNQ